MGISSRIFRKLCDEQGPVCSYSYRNARTGCSIAARRAGKTLNTTAMATAPRLTRMTLQAWMSVGISLK